MAQPGLGEQVGDRRALLVVAAAAPDHLVGPVQRPGMYVEPLLRLDHGMGEPSDSAWKSMSCQRVSVPPQSKMTATGCMTRTVAAAHGTAATCSHRRSLRRAGTTDDGPRTAS